MSEIPDSQPEVKSIPHILKTVIPWISVKSEYDIGLPHFRGSPISKESGASLQATEGPLRVEGKPVAKGVLVEWNENTL